FKAILHGEVLLQLSYDGQGGSIPAGRKDFAISSRVFENGRMTQPLALILYERLLPGTQLVNRLQDLNYRVQTLADANLLVAPAEQANPMLVLADLEASRNSACAAIAELKKNPATQHLPVIAFARENARDLEAAAKAAGVTFLVTETALLN